MDVHWHLHVGGFQHFCYSKITVWYEANKGFNCIVIRGFFIILEMASLFIHALEYIREFRMYDSHGILSSREKTLDLLLH